MGQEQQLELKGKREKVRDREKTERKSGELTANEEVETVTRRTAATGNLTTA